MGIPTPLNNVWNGDVVIKNRIIVSQRSEDSLLSEYLRNVVEGDGLVESLVYKM